MQLKHVTERDLLTNGTDCSCYLDFARTLQGKKKKAKKKKKLIGLISSSVSLEDNKGFCSDEDFKPLFQRVGGGGAKGGSVISLVIQLMNSGG